MAYKVSLFTIPSALSSNHLIPCMNSQAYFGIHFSPNRPLNIEWMILENKVVKIHYD